jgi:hypothetical protein
MRIVGDSKSDFPRLPRRVTARIKAGLAAALVLATGACTAPGPDLCSGAPIPPGSTRTDAATAKDCAGRADPVPINWFPLT